MGAGKLQGILISRMHRTLADGIMSFYRRTKETVAWNPRLQATFLSGML
jgi:hypothetical protein